MGDLGCPLGMGESRRNDSFADRSLAPMAVIETGAHCPNAADATICGQGPRLGFDGRVGRWLAVELTMEAHSTAANVLYGTY